jgi:hypothetical protein
MMPSRNAPVHEPAEVGSRFDVQHRTHPKSVSFCQIGTKKVKHATTAAGVSDSVLAKELTQLSLSEREQALSDLHGVADVVDETPEMVEQAFLAMEVEISKIKKRGAYDKACFLSPRYAQSRDFRIKFLRADRFDARMAAQRLVNNFELKLKLFGYDRLARDITFEDLSDQGRHDLMLGGVWVLKGYDRTGRKIIMVSLEEANLDSDNVSIHILNSFIPAHTHILTLPRHVHCSARNFMVLVHECCRGPPGAEEWPCGYPLLPGK